MDTRTIYELVGYVGSALVVISLMMRSLLRLRLINLVGATVFAVYGVLIDAAPVWAVNGAIAVIDVYHLRGMLRRDREYFEVLEVDRGSEYLARFLDFHRDQIARFQPDWEGVRPDHRAFFVLRDMVPAGLVLARPAGVGTMHVDLDYVIPGYRDFKVGSWVYRDEALFGAHVTAAAATPEHRRYLRRVGFEPAGDHYRLVR